MTTAATPPPLELDVAGALAHVHAAGTVLDVRDEPCFAAGHLEGAGRLSPAEFEPRRAELPPRDSAVLVLDEQPHGAELAARALGALGYSKVRWLGAPLEALPGGRASRGPASRLWRPSPFLERVASMLPSEGSVLDLAAGSGREAVWMATRGYDVNAWDRAPEALSRAHALAGTEGVRLHTRVVDLERPDRPDPGKHHVVMVFRFLHRTILPWIAAAVAPGGMLVYETYATGQERFGRPKHPRFLFQPGEIARAFEGLRVLVHEEPRPEGGPILARIVAVRDSPG